MTWESYIARLQVNLAMWPSLEHLTAVCSCTVVYALLHGGCCVEAHCQGLLFRQSHVWVSDAELQQYNLLLVAACLQWLPALHAMTSVHRIYMKHLV